MINGEKSSFNNTVFGKRRKRTIEAILNNLQTKFDPSVTKNSSLLSLSQQQHQKSLDANTAVTVSKRMREELRKAEFLRVGQVSFNFFF